MHHLLTPGNLKLGKRGLIWGFGLPSGRPEICVGMSDPCGEHCHARQIERLRPAVLQSYLRNYELSRTREFEAAVVAFVRLNEIAVVRIHTGGDFYAAAYARKWLRIMRRLPRVRFYAYTRSWRHRRIRPVLEEMARQPNCRIWYSCDEGTGLPAQVPEGVRVAWLMARADEEPAGDLVFRVRRLRRRPARRIGLVLVCPVENGVTGRDTDCGRCGVCWQ
jgi:hypothetical protein